MCNKRHLWSSVDWYPPLINTLSILQFALDSHLGQQLTHFWSMYVSWSALNQLLIKCWRIVLTKYWYVAQDVDWGHWSSILINSRLWVPLVHTNHVFIKRQLVFAGGETFFNRSSFKKNLIPLGGQTRQVRTNLHTYTDSYNVLNLKLTYTFYFIVL